MKTMSSPSSTQTSQNPILEAWQIQAPRQHQIVDEETNSSFTIPFYGSPSIDELSYYSSLTGVNLRFTEMDKDQIQQFLGNFLILAFRLGTWNGESVVLDEENSHLKINEIVPSHVPFSLYLKIFQYLMDRVEDYGRKSGGDSASQGKSVASKIITGDSSKSSPRQKSSKGKTLAVVPST